MSSSARLNVSQPEPARRAVPRAEHAPAAGLNAERPPMAGLARLLLSVILIGSAWPVTKYAVEQGAAALWFAEGRAAFSGLTATALLLALRRFRLPRRTDMPALLAVGLFQIGAFFAFSHAGVALVPAGRTAVLSNTTTIWITPLAPLVLGERISARRWLAAGLGLLGVLVLVGPWAIDWSSGRVLLGNAYLLAAAASWSVAILVVRRHPPRSGFLPLLPWCFGLGALVLLPVAMTEPAGAWRAPAWQAMAYIGLLAAPVGTWMVVEATAMLPAMISSIGFLLVPAIGLFLSTIWLGEPLGPDLAAGTALILGGVALAAWPGRRA